MRIVSVEPTVPVIDISWMIGSRCNYDCMYCPAELHDQTSSHSSLDKLKAAWGNIYNKTQHIGLPYKIVFTGGEVTANKSFLPLVKYLKDNDFNVQQIFVTTNGSASLNYYQRLAKLVNGITFSTHSEFINEVEFFNKVKALDQILIRPEKSLHVSVMDEFWNQERIKLYQQWLDCHKISYSINSIDYSSKTRDIPLRRGVYNIEQI